MSLFQCLRILLAEPSWLEYRLYLANVTMPLRQIGGWPYLSRPWRRALAAYRSGAMGVRGILRLDLRAGARLARHADPIERGRHADADIRTGTDGMRPCQ